MTGAAAIDLLWLPLGAGGRSVRFNGRVFEAIVARTQHRPACDLYHSALEITSDDARFVIEMALAWDAEGVSRGVVAEGPVGARWAGRSRLFRYEIRCWQDGRIPDADEAVESPQRLSTDAVQAARVLELVRVIPTPTWGRDELGAGEMWNSNSVVAWLLAPQRRRSVQREASGGRPSAGLERGARGCGPRRSRDRVRRNPQRAGGPPRMTWGGDGRRMRDMATETRTFRRIARAVLAWLGAGLRATGSLMYAPAHAGTALTLCPGCGADHVCPVDWETANQSRWSIRLRCGACEACRDVVVSNDEAAALDVVLARQTAEIERAAARLDQQRMAGELDAFVAALRHDLIDASSFA